MKNTSNKKASKFVLTATAFAVASFVNSMAVNAQQANDNTESVEQEAALERIVVTARRKVESLQEVPVAVTSVSAQDLQDRGISVLTAIQQFSHIWEA